MPAGINMLTMASELNNTFTITRNQSVYLNFNSGNVVLLNTFKMKVFFMLDDELISNPQAWVQSSAGAIADYCSISLQHVLEGLDVGTHTISIQ